jgi:hypothetical protein
VDTQTASTGYEYWTAACSGAKVEKQRGVAHLGFYRTTSRGEPVAIWKDASGEVVAKVGAKGRVVPADEGWCERVFSYCQAVTEQQYRGACANNAWHDHHPLLGDNVNASGEDDIQTKIDDLRLEAQSIIRKGEATSQADADAAANLAARIEDLTKQLEQQQNLETGPYTAEIQRLETAMRQFSPQLAPRSTISGRRLSGRS